MNKFVANLKANKTVYAKRALVVAATVATITVIYVATRGDSSLAEIEILPAAE